jgi:hypothetical protein
MASGVDGVAAPRERHHVDGVDANTLSLRRTAHTRAAPREYHERATTRKQNAGGSPSTATT